MADIALGVADKTPHTRNVSHWGITRGGVAQPGIILNVAATLQPKLGIDVAALQIFGEGCTERWNSGNLKSGRWSAMPGIGVPVFQFSRFLLCPQPSLSPPTKIDAVHGNVDSSPCMSAEIWISGKLELCPILPTMFLQCLALYFFFM
ncbi:hypothetical protein [Nitrosomonas communis]|uniref:hypothetical protein n=1 Tax=Nitrosomonas communis TaxID=44574 RepID=UPI0026EA3D53|nr:hypothetical protein [Nitrosomonas communis]MCO6427613.1 hypothetical protein [Nitrosomonas communis]